MSSVSFIMPSRSSAAQLADRDVELLGGGRDLGALLLASGGSARAARSVVPWLCAGVWIAWCARYRKSGARAVRARAVRGGVVAQRGLGLGLEERRRVLVVRRPPTPSRLKSYSERFTHLPTMLSAMSPPQQWWQK